MPKRNNRPRLSAVALIHHEGKILVGARRRGAYKGTYVLPGGGVELGESIVRALTREVKEETGLDVTVEDPAVLDVVEMVGKKSHRVLLIVAAEPHGSIQDTDELKDVRFVDPEELLTMNTQKWVVSTLRRIGIIE
jgi:8-oxo-dGTP diphosphatase